MMILLVLRLDDCKLDSTRLAKKVKSGMTPGSWALVPKVKQGNYVVFPSSRPIILNHGLAG